MYNTYHKEVPAIFNDFFQVQLPFIWSLYKNIFSRYSYHLYDFFPGTVTIYMITTQEHLHVSLRSTNCLKLVSVIKES